MPKIGLALQTVSPVGLETVRKPYFKPVCVSVLPGKLSNQAVQAFCDVQVPLHVGARCGILTAAESKGEELRQIGEEQMTEAEALHLGHPT